MVAHITKTFETKLSAKPGERAVVARISTTAVDRDGDVMLPSGLDVKDFNKNPVVLLAHNAGTLPIGKVDRITKGSNDVVAKVLFAERPASHPITEEWIPDTVFDLFKQQVLNAFSVGFIIDDARSAEAKDVSKFGDGVRRIVNRWRLVELSVVPVPANQEALAVAVSKSWLGRHCAWGKLKKNDPLRLDSPKKLVLSMSKPLNISAV